MGIIRDSFVMFKNWSDAIEALPEEFQLETYKALSKYGLTGEMPENMSPVVRAILISFSKGMENNIARYNASVENGKKGGRPRKEQPSEENEQPGCENENLEKPRKTQENLNQPNHNLNVNVNVNDSVNVNENVNENKNLILKERMKELNIGASARDNTTKQHKLESYDQVMTDMCVENSGLRDVLFEFIRHCQLNGRMVTNDKLKQLILRLDFAFPRSITNEFGREVDPDVQKIKAVRKAINSGYFDIPDLRDGI